MILRQFLHSDPVAISYLFGCGGKATCAVVDPVGDVASYLRVADDTGMNIKYVIDTHIHADHRSAGRELAHEVGAQYVLHASAEVGFSTRAVKDGDRLLLGNVHVDVMHTPGHTPEHICLLVTDRTRAEWPWLVLTGHTLMVGDVGRTELVGDPASAALTLFTGLERLRALPDHIEVMPGAYTGSVCGRRLSGKPSSTIGFERRHNTAFKTETAEAFVGFMLDDVPPPPEGAAELRAWNTGRGAVAAE
jgi:glyoxylase-like metal-dependent hydrolase (beta-lactamase superfamily II)